MKTTPKDFFLHLGATIALYVAAGALINLWLSVINYAFPDALASSYYANSIVWPVSMLIVLTPILYGLEWLIARDIRKAPGKKDIWVRKWRIYLTIFLAVVLLGGDLIALINTYLNGEISVRFVWKIVAILLISGSIGKYYFFSIAESWKHAKLVRTGNAWFGIVLVIAAIVSGFIVVGSPAKQRALRFDSQRVNDLSNIQWQVISYWQTKGALPKALSDASNPLSGATIPTDPDTKAPYEYADTSSGGTVSFKLCATFGLASQDATGRGAYGGGGISYPSSSNVSYAYPGSSDDVWVHTAGHACFDRTIDPDRYPVMPKSVPK